LLTTMRTIVGRHGAVLIGIDLRKDPQVLEHAYNDAAGVTARFNLNALQHLNRELGADFDLDAFEHCAVWIEDMSRIEMRLVSKRDQEVHLGRESIRFRRGEAIRTECCHKYTLEGFAELAASAGLEVTHVWTDAERKFSVQMLAAVDS
jgi:L-histidine N-alpha-methyltransferase